MRNQWDEWHEFVDEHKKKYRPSLRIFYCWWGGQFLDRKHAWCAIEEKTQNIWDYGSREYLVNEAIKNHQSYKVERHHKNGEISILEERIFT